MMLIEFRFQNHRSIRDEQVFTMEAAHVGDPEDPRPRHVPGLSGSLLPVAALYGANASGKSNILSALGFMRDAVLDSHQSWPPRGGIPRDAFAWGSAAREPSLFEVTLLSQGTRCCFGFVVDNDIVLEEWLYVWPKTRRQIWFEREGNTFSFGEKLRGENRIIEQVTRKNALFLSTAAQHQHDQLMPIYKWFHDLRMIRVEGYKERYSDAMPAAVAASMFAALAAASAASAVAPNGMIRLYDLMPRPNGTDESVDRLDALDKESAERFRQLLRAADIGILDFRVEGPRTEGAKGKRPRKVFMRHEAGGENGWLSLEHESAGTRALFHLGPVAVEVLRSGGVLVVDELEASLHTLLALEIIKQFNDPLTNPQNAQLVFTTHDTHLLGTMIGEPPLRRDQVWLTEKDNEGGTCLYPLTEYKPRKAENIERGYMQGRYGAIPLLGMFSRLRD